MKIGEFLIKEELSIKAGGPGSGRHPAYGKFTKSPGSKVHRFYTANSGKDVIHVESRGKAGQHIIHESGLPAPGVAFKGNGNSAREFLNNRYGIKE